jgi:hypothetical protein
MLVAVPAQVHQAVQVAAAVWVATLEEQRLQGKVMQVAQVGQQMAAQAVRQVVVAGHMLRVRQEIVVLVVMVGRELCQT